MTIIIILGISCAILHFIAEFKRIALLDKHNIKSIKKLKQMGLAISIEDTKVIKQIRILRIIATLFMISAFIVFFS